MKKLQVDAIQNRMEELGMNQANLAKELDVTRESVSQWLKNAKMPRPASLLKLAILLKMSFSEIIIKEEPVGSFAYRTRKKAGLDEHRLENAELMKDLLYSIFKNTEPSSLLAIPKLDRPSVEYTYVQKAAHTVRDMMKVDATETITLTHIIDLMRSFAIILIPVLWSEKGDQALTVHLFKPNIFCMYINLETQLCDFIFWLVHELAHILTPDLLGEDAERFADSFAGALLFPEACANKLAEELSSTPNVGIKINKILNNAKKRNIAPFCIYTEINRSLINKGEAELDFKPHGAMTNYRKNIPYLHTLLFEKDNPSVKEYIEKVSAFFGPTFWDALTQWIIENNKTSGAVQAVLHIPLSDAKEVFAYLTKKKEIPN